MLIVLCRKQLNESLSELTKSSSAVSTQIPPEIIEYVDQGRNPDIYTREFVELVQSSNQELKGKCEAFASFRDILGEELVKAMPELKDDVARILAGGPVVEEKKKLARIEQTSDTKDYRFAFPEAL